MVFANDIRQAILTLADQRVGEIFYLREVAKLIDSENWARLIDQVKLVAESLIEEGRITPVGTDNPERAYTKKLPYKEDN